VLAELGGDAFAKVLGLAIAAPRVASSAMSWTEAVRAWVDAGAPAPPAVAYGAALVEVAIVAGALASLGRARPARGAFRVASLPRREAVALFAAAFLVLNLLGGWHAIVWQDTSNDQRDVTRCLVEHACTRRGEGTSVLGLSHAVAWLDVRTLAARAGLGLDHLHVLLQILNAWSVVLVASAAFRAGTRLLAACAAIAMLYWIPNLARLDPVYNSVPIPFLAAVLLLSGTAAAERPSAGSVTRLALVAAVLANVHAGCVVAGVSVVAVALLARGRRIRLAAVAAIVFAAATFAIAPGTWIHNARRAIEIAGQHGAGEHAGRDLGQILRYGLLGLVSAGVAVDARRRGSGWPRLLDAAAAIALPIVLTSLAVMALGVFTVDTKYLGHAAAAEAVLCGAAAAAIARRRPGVLARTRPGRLTRAANLHPILLPAALAACSAVPRPGLFLTYRDLAVVARELSLRGFRYVDAFRGLKAEGDAVVIDSLRVASPGFGERPDAPGPRDDERNAFLLRLPPGDLPRPLPPSWVLVREAWPRSLVLVFGAPAVDWSRFEACAPPDRCVPSGIALGDRVPDHCASCLPGLPQEHEAVGRTVELRLATRAGPQRIHMPRGWNLCGGRVTEVPGPSGLISADGRTATWDAPAGGEVRIQWRVATKECPRFTFSGFPPFFVEGDARAVAAIEAAVPLGD
jgi:hypothetical protein